MTADEIRKKHSILEDDGSPSAALYAGTCAGCDKEWPCDTIRALDLVPLAVSEAVERIVSALQDLEDSEDKSWNFYAYEVDDEVLDLLRSRDWSKGEG
jgi:hypothetical protein